MTGIDIVNILIPKLIDMGFVVHRYDAYSTSSIYLKLDYGVSCGIRIADHPGKQKYRYRFNVIKDYIGNKVILKNGLICRFFNFDEVDNILAAVQHEKQEKINKYGVEKYIKLMEVQSQNHLYTRFKQVH